MPCCAEENSVKRSFWLRELHQWMTVQPCYRGKMFRLHTRFTRKPRVCIEFSEDVPHPTPHTPHSHSRVTSLDIHFLTSATKVGRKVLFLFTYKSGTIKPIILLRLYGPLVGRQHMPLIETCRLLGVPQNLLTIKVWRSKQSLSITLLRMVLHSSAVSS
jgi:hypothetical protein